MADRQRPSIDVASPRIQERISGGMEKGPSRTDAVCGGKRDDVARFELQRQSGVLLSKLTETVYHGRAPGTAFATPCRRMGRPDSTSGW